MITTMKTIYELRNNKWVARAICSTLAAADIRIRQLQASEPKKRFKIA